MLRLSIIFFLFSIQFGISQDISGLDIVKKSIDFHGGYERYDSIKQFNYIKEITSFNPSDEIESTKIQTIKYDRSKPLNGSLEWQVDTVEYRIVCNDSCYYYVNGLLSESYTPSSAKSSFLSSEYVLFMPFKLLDPGVKLVYQGLDTLEDGMKVYAVNAIYNTKIKTHTRDHVWTYYFNCDSFRLEGGMVDHGSRFSYIRNNSFVKKNGILFHEKRKSFRCDSLRNIERRTTEYIYRY